MTHSHNERSRDMFLSLKDKENYSFSQGPKFGALRSSVRLGSDHSEDPLLEFYGIKSSKVKQCQSTFSERQCKEQRPVKDVSEAPLLMPNGIKSTKEEQCQSVFSKRQSEEQRPGKEDVLLKEYGIISHYSSPPEQLQGIPELRKGEESFFRMPSSRHSKKSLEPSFSGSSKGERTTVRMSTDSSTKFPEAGPSHIGLQKASVAGDSMPRTRSSMSVNKSVQECVVKPEARQADDGRIRSQFNGYSSKNVYLHDIQKKILHINILVGMLSFIIIISGLLVAGAYLYTDNVQHGAYQKTCSEQSVQTPENTVDRVSGSIPVFINYYMRSVVEELKSLKAEIIKIKTSEVLKNTSEVQIPLQKDVFEETLMGEPDLASDKNMGRVVATPDTSTTGVEEASFLGYHLPRRTPSVVLQGAIQEVEDCWEFAGQRGRLVLALARPTLLSAVSISHLTAAVTNMDTAPSQFVVKAHKSADNFDDGITLGEFEYSAIGPWKQRFSINPQATKGEYFSIIEFQFLNNHGNADHTCVYRVHVHGIMK